MTDRDALVLPLDSAAASLERVGGKSRSLARLAAAGLPVPEGFLLCTAAYETFVEANALKGRIVAFTQSTSSAEHQSAVTAAADIRSLFQNGTMPSATAEAIVAGYQGLGGDRPPVAVRSSATAEDLPGLSFAGQQDTYLNVHGEVELLAAVQRCWGSLWTARAIGYRAKMGIDHAAVSMGLVVQLMVDAEVAGILFTAHPATGDRTQMLINASYGLGEAVVSGEVTPDSYVLDRANFAVSETVIGAKQTMVVPSSDQGTDAEDVPPSRQAESSLDPATLTKLAELAIHAEQLFDDIPQDIEWAVVDSTCWLLQSRPITNLPAPPLRDVTWDPPSEGTKLIRRQVVENMPDPLSPLFDDLYLSDGLEAGLDQFVEDIGMPIKIDELVERPMFLTVNGFAYCRASYRIGWHLLRLVPRIFYWYARSLTRLLRSFIPHWRDEGLPRYLATVEQYNALELQEASDTQLLTGIRALATADATYWLDVAVVMGIAKVTDGLLNGFLTSRAVPGTLTSGVFLRGYPSKTLAAQNDLEALAARARENDSLRELIRATPADALLAALSTEPDARDLREALATFLDLYGHQIYTLDFAVPTQAEDPLPVLLSLKALVNEGGIDSTTRQAEMVQQRHLREQEVLSSVGRVRGWLFRKLLGWAQAFGPNREEALFYMGAGWPVLRRLAHTLGERLTAAGTLRNADDIYYLRSVELESAIDARASDVTCPDFPKRAAQRRLLRESRKHLHPPGMVPEKSTMKFGFIDLSLWETQKRNSDESNVLNGFAVSPGKVTGPACVVLSPADFAAMKPDTILVCPTTTPAWTPLFTQAAALVTDIGGILAHGSIVAREYGIPAVMGTGNVTKRIVSGQQITVDGDAGTVTILPEDQSSEASRR